MKKIVVLGTSDAWSVSRLSKQTSVLYCKLTNFNSTWTCLFETESLFSLLLVNFISALAVIVYKTKMYYPHTKKEYEVDPSTY